MTLREAIGIATMAVCLSNAQSPAYGDFDNLIDSAPRCWEDEVIVLVIYDPYGDLDENNTVGCVPASNLPTSGYRPEETNQ